MLLLGGAFTVLLLITGAPAVIFPPANVSVSCRNTNVTVSWDYAGDRQTKFTVNWTDGSSVKKLGETTERRFDLTRFVWDSEDFLTSMVVSVSAEQRGRSSAAAASQTFTFNSLRPATLTCQLDLPPVDLDLTDFGAVVTFKNPVRHFEELKTLKYDKMLFSITTAAEVFERECRRGDEVCRLDFSYPVGGEEKCVSLTGELTFGVIPVTFTKAENICPSSAEPFHVALIIVLVAVGLVVVVATTIICVTKAWTLKNASLPEFLEEFDENTKQLIATVHKPSTSSVTVHRPCRNPSVSSEDDGARTDDSADDSAKTESSVCMEEVQEEYEEYKEQEQQEEEEEEQEEEEEDPYDRPHFVQVDLGDGDMATGYTDRNVSL